MATKRRPRRSPWWRTSPRRPPAAPALDRAPCSPRLPRRPRARGRHRRCKAQAALDGRRFAVRLRFGCGGPAGEASSDALRWRVKSDESLEITATPDLSLDAPELAGAVTQTVEAVEGFWIPRPWLLSDACPAAEGRRRAAPAPDHSSGSRNITRRGVAHRAPLGPRLCQHRAGRAGEPLPRTASSCSSKAACSMAPAARRSIVRLGRRSSAAPCAPSLHR